MNLYVIIIIALGLSMDSFAIALSAGMSGNIPNKWIALRMSVSFACFQGLLPVLGWYLGGEIEPMISSIDHWIAFGLLGIVGWRMIRSGLDRESESVANDPSRGPTLILLSVATSIDALAVGLSFGMLAVEILYPALIIGIVTFIISMTGAYLGHRLDSVFGKRMEILGGVILILIGFRILMSHITGI